MKSDRSEEIQVLYEIAMAVGEGLDLVPMLSKSLSIILRKLNCSAGAIYLVVEQDVDSYRFRLNNAIPRNPSRNPGLEQAALRLPAQLNESGLSDWWETLPHTGQAPGQVHFHMVSLAPHGLLTMVRTGRPLSLWRSASRHPRLEPISR